MSKQILILAASPRRGGNSDLLCSAFAQGAAGAGHTVETVYLREKQIHYCTGCGACSEHGLPCPQKDDMPAILEQMLSADVIVLATPVYFYTMNAQMKTLIDRTCSRYTELKGKEFYFLLTAAEPDVKKMERTVESFRGFTACLEDPVERGILYGVGAWKIGDIQGMPILEEAREMGRQV